MKKPLRIVIAFAELNQWDFDYVTDISATFSRKKSKEWKRKFNALKWVAIRQKLNFKVTDSKNHIIIEIQERNHEQRI